MPASLTCRICGAAGDMPRFEAREMMFGLRDRFGYFQCADCGCLQIEALPADISPYYPASYYSFRPAPEGPPSFRERLVDLRNRLALADAAGPARLLYRGLPRGLRGSSAWLAATGVTSRSRVLDVGCGAGDLLRQLRRAGCTNLLGIDPFIAGDLHYPDGVTILKRSIDEIGGEFDLVMLHHALEHVADQLGTLRAVRGILAPGGYCLVRVPTVSSEAWDRYREDWVQLDAPRHFFLHSVESLRRLGERAGLRLARVDFDSTALQFAGSELYRRDIPLTRLDGQFTPRELRAFRRRARRLNAARRGDQAAFYFTSS